MYHIFNNGGQLKQQYYITKLMSLHNVTRTLQMSSMSTRLLTFMKAKIEGIFILIKRELQRLVISDHLPNISVNVPVFFFCDIYNIYDISKFGHDISKIISNVKCHF